MLSNAVGVSLTISNSTLTATRYAASVVGGTIRDVAIAVTDSRLALTGADDVGIVALAAATVFNAAVNVAASSVTCKAGSVVGVLGAGSVSAVTWTNVTVFAALANVTSTAGEQVGVLGAWSYVYVAADKSATWADVTVVLVVPRSPAGRRRCLRPTAYHIRPPGAKNPYNPVLGEVFGCVFNPDQKQRRVRFLAEQVHPPVTAMNVDCGTGFAKFFGIMHPRSKLVSLNCAGSIVEGCGVLTLDPSCLADRSGTAAASAAPGGSAAAAHHNTTGGGSSSAPTLRYSISWPSVFVRAASRWGPCAWSWAVTLSSKTWTPARRCR